MFDLVIYSVILLIIDAIYLSSFSKDYDILFRKIQGKPLTVKIVPAVVVYMLLVGSWFMFIYKEMHRYTTKEIIGRAFMLGFFIYGVFDATNMAIFDQYSARLAIIDSFWGGILFGLTTALFKGLKNFKKI